MLLPDSVYDPPFQVTRASHVVLHVADLEASERFYREVIGLVVTAREGDSLLLRGVEEACHHSLVLRRAEGGRACAWLGLRVFRDEDLDKAKDWFESQGCRAEWAEVPHQGRTLRTQDSTGLPTELCARMDVVPRMIARFDQHRGGCAQRIDHFQVLVPEVRESCAFWMSAGFRLTEYVVGEGDEMDGAFLQRKGNPHDIVLFKGTGPRLHHFAFTSPDTHTLLRACDIAGVLGHGRNVERGPGRHGPGHAMFVYFRDPDGHRVGLFNTHYQVMDIEIEPARWTFREMARSGGWGLPARRQWFEQATPFPGVEPRPPAVPAAERTLEKFLAEQG